MLLRIVCLSLLTHGFAAYAASTCEKQGHAKIVEVDKVFDGDTLQLNSGERIRLIGINTPELSRQEQPAQPLAVRARHHLQKLLSDEKRVWLQTGQQRFDRYGRRLAHVFLLDGRSVEVELLSQGLAFHIVIPPNLTYMDCLKNAEREARKQAIGVWREQYYRPINAKELDGAKRGFRRVQGIVDKLVAGQGGWWIELDGDVVLRIAAKDVQYFAQFPVQALRGKHVLVRGWLSGRHQKKKLLKRGYNAWVMYVKHPAAIESVK